MWLAGHTGVSNLNTGFDNCSINDQLTVVFHIMPQKRCFDIMPRSGVWNLNKSHAQLYRSFRRRAVVTTAAIFAIGLVAALELGASGNVWVAASWAAIISPILAAMAICLLAPLERMAVSLGLSRGGTLTGINPTIVCWLALTIVLPWIAAWLVADLSGNWFDAWYSSKGSEEGSVYLWSVRLLAGVLTYSIASAIGLVLAFYIDRNQDEMAGHEG